ncbi:MAG: hypothetical protein EXS68_00680 [Candidatus Ryanbacteria bacterium]|nr:hypothetical protein [Candidatus Ryanbacteria bacterium]
MESTEKTERRKALRARVTALLALRTMQFGDNKAGFVAEGFASELKELNATLNRMNAEFRRHDAERQTPQLRAQA